MASQFKERVGRNMKKYRELSGKSQVEVAKAIGITDSTYHKYEAGFISRIDVEMLVKIAQAIGCTVENLTEWGKGEHEAYHDEMEAKRLAKHNKLYNQLTFDNQKLIDEHISFLLTQQKSQKTHKDSDKSN